MLVDNGTYENEQCTHDDLLDIVQAVEATLVCPIEFRTDPSKTLASAHRMVTDLHHLGVLKNKSEDTGCSVLYPVHGASVRDAVGYARIALSSSLLENVALPKSWGKERFELATLLMYRHAARIHLFGAVESGPITEFCRLAPYVHSCDWNAPIYRGLQGILLQDGKKAPKDAGPRAPGRDITSARSNISFMQQLMRGEI